MINGYQGDPVLLKQQMERLADEFAYTIFLPLVDAAEAAADDAELTKLEEMNADWLKESLKAFPNAEAGKAVEAYQQLNAHYDQLNAEQVKTLNALAPQVELAKEISVIAGQASAAVVAAASLDVAKVVDDIAIIKEKIVAMIAAGAFDQKRADNGILLTINSFMDALPRTAKLLRPSSYGDINVGVQDALAVSFFASQELGRTEESPITRVTLNEIKRVADDAYIYFLGKQGFDSAILNNVNRLLGTDYSRQGWQKAREGYHAYKVVVAELAALKDDTAKPGTFRDAVRQLHDILKAKAVMLILEILRDKDFVDSKMQGFNQMKLSLFSSPPGGGKGELGARLFGWYGDIVDKFTLYHSRQMRPLENQNEHYLFRIKEYLQREISQRMFQAANIELDYWEVMVKLMAKGYVTSTTISVDKDGKKVVAALISEDFQGFDAEFYQLFPDTIDKSVFQKIERVLIVARDMSIRLSNKDVITASVNKQVQGMAAVSFEDDYDFFVDENLKIVYMPTQVTVKGLDVVFSAPKVTVLEGGLAWFDELTKKYGKEYASVFLSPFSQEDMNKFAAKPFSYSKAYDKAIELQARDNEARMITPIKDFEMMVEDAGVKGYAAGEEQLESYLAGEEKQPGFVDKYPRRALREADIIKYKTVLNIHLRDSKTNKLTGTDDLKNRAEEAALQMQRRYEYNVVVVNEFKGPMDEFQAKMYRVLNDFTYQVFGTVADMAEGVNVSEADRADFLRSIGVDITEEEILRETAEQQGLMPFFNNDFDALLSQAKVWQGEIKEKLGKDVTVRDIIEGQGSLEPFQILDSDGNMKNEVKPRALVHYDGDWHRDVRIYFINNGEVLLQKRGIEKDIEPDLLAHGVAGHAGIGETYEQNAIRETREEISVDNIDQTRLIKLGVFKDDISGAKHAINRSHYALYAYAMTDEERGCLKSKEGISVWMPLEEFKQGVATQPEKYVDSMVQELQNKVVTDQLDALVVWAAKTEEQWRQGGINLDPASLNMTVERTGRAIKVQVDPAEIQRIRTEGVNGFTPVIINIMPVKSMLPALGLVEAEAVAATS